MSRESDALLARIRQMRRIAGRTATHPAPGAEPVRVQDLQARIDHLEEMLQGLQDSVYREAQRQDTRIAELEKQIQPAALAAALSKDARDRGL